MKRNKSKEFLILNLILLLYAVFIVTFSPFFPPTATMMFDYFPDSRMYHSAGESYVHFQAGEFTIIRTWLISCFLWLSDFLGGAWLVFILQFLFWITSGNLLYYSVQKITPILKYRIIAVSVYALNLSLLFQTFYALSEITSLLLLSLLLFFTLHAVRKGFGVRYFITLLLLSSLLTVVKPVFVYPFLCVVFFGTIGLAKKIFSHWKYPVLVVVVCLPVLFQLSFIYGHHHQVKISRIGENTFTHRFFAQGLQAYQRQLASHENALEKDTSRFDSQKKPEKYSKSEQLHFILAHKQIYARIFFKNIYDNVYTHPDALHAYSASWMYKVANFYNKMFQSPVFLLFLVVFISVIAVDIWKKQIRTHWQFYLLSVFFYYIIATLSITYWVGDRLLVPTTSLWIVLYLYLFLRVLDRYKKWKTARVWSVNQGRSSHHGIER